MGKVDKGAPCNVVGCRNSALRSLSKNDMGTSGLSISGDGRRVYLCSDHYKAWKKATKKSKSIERSRW